MKLRIYYVYWMYREVQSSFLRLITRLTVLYDQKLKWKKNIQKQFNSKRQLLLQTPRTTDATTRTAFVKTPVDIFRSMLRVLKDRYQQQQKMHCGRISITSTSQLSTYHRGLLLLAQPCIGHYLCAWAAAVLGQEAARARAEFYFSTQWPFPCRCRPNVCWVMYAVSPIYSFYVSQARD